MKLEEAFNLGYIACMNKSGRSVMGDKKFISALYETGIGLKSQYLREWVHGYDTANLDYCRHLITDIKNRQKKSGLKISTTGEEALLNRLTEKLESRRWKNAQ